MSKRPLEPYESSNNIVIIPTVNCYHKPGGPESKKLKLNDNVSNIIYGNLVPQQRNSPIQETTPATDNIQDHWSLDTSSVSPNFRKKTDATTSAVQRSTNDGIAHDHCEKPNSHIARNANSQNVPVSTKVSFTTPNVLSKDVELNFSGYGNSPKQDRSWASSFMTSMGVQQKKPIRLNLTSTKIGNKAIETPRKEPLRQTKSQTKSVINESGMQGVPYSGNPENTINHAISKIAPIQENPNKQTERTILAKTFTPVKSCQKQNKAVGSNDPRNPDYNSEAKNCCCPINKETMPQASIPSAILPNYLPNYKKNMDTHLPEPSVQLHTYPNYTGTGNIKTTSHQSPPVSLAVYPNYSDVSTLSGPTSVDPNYCDNCPPEHNASHRVQKETDAHWSPVPLSVYPNYADLRNCDKNYNTEKRFVSTYKIPKLSSKCLSDSDSERLPRKSIKSHQFENENLKCREIDNIANSRRSSEDDLQKQNNKIIKQKIEKAREKENCRKVTSKESKAKRRRLLDTMNLSENVKKDDHQINQDHKSKVEKTVDNKYDRKIKKQQNSKSTSPSHKSELCAKTKSVKNLDGIEGKDKTKTSSTTSKTKRKSFESNITHKKDPITKTKMSSTNSKSTLKSVVQNISYNKALPSIKDKETNAPKGTTIQKSSQKNKKEKKVKLVINIQYQEDDNSSSEESKDDEEKDSDTACISSNLDLSFLDNLNVDEIVSCLESSREETPASDLDEPAIDLSEHDLNVTVFDCLDTPNIKEETDFIKTDSKDELEEIKRYLALSLAHQTTENNGIPFSIGDRSCLQESPLSSNEPLVLPMSMDQGPPTIDSKEKNYQLEKDSISTSLSHQINPILRVKTLTEINSDINIIQDINAGEELRNTVKDVHNSSTETVVIEPNAVQEIVVDLTGDLEPDGLICKHNLKSKTNTKTCLENKIDTTTCVKNKKETTSCALKLKCAPTSTEVIDLTTRMICKPNVESEVQTKTCSLKTKCSPISAEVIDLTTSLICKPNEKSEVQTKTYSLKTECALTITKVVDLTTNVDSYDESSLATIQIKAIPTLEDKVTDEDKDVDILDISSEEDIDDLLKTVLTMSNTLSPSTLRVINDEISTPTNKDINLDKSTEHKTESDTSCSLNIVSTKESAIQDNKHLPKNTDQIITDKAENETLDNSISQSRQDENTGKIVCDKMDTTDSSNEIHTKESTEKYNMHLLNKIDGMISETVEHETLDNSSSESKEDEYSGKIVCDTTDTTVPLKIETETFDKPISQSRKEENTGKIVCDTTVPLNGVHTKEGTSNDNPYLLNTTDEIVSVKIETETFDKPISQSRKEKNTDKIVFDTIDTTVPLNGVHIMENTSKDNTDPINKINDMVLVKVEHETLEKSSDGSRKEENTGKIVCDTIDTTVPLNGVHIMENISKDNTDPINNINDMVLVKVEHETLEKSSDGSRKEENTGKIVCDTTDTTVSFNRVQLKESTSNNTDGMISVKADTQPFDNSGSQSSKEENTGKTTSETKVSLNVVCTKEITSKDNTYMPKTDRIISEKVKIDTFDNTSSRPLKDVNAGTSSGISLVEGSKIKKAKIIKEEKDKNSRSPIVFQPYEQFSPKPKHKHYRRIEFKNMLPGDKVMVGHLEKRMLTVLDKAFVVTEFIRKGRISKIYKCKDMTGKNYAVKIIWDEQYRYQMGIEKEEMLMKIQKDIPKENLNFVFINNGFGFGNKWCFLMEYCSKNLLQVLHESGTSLHIDIVQRLSHQLVSAVTVLRNNKIVHSDIKPTHILLNSAGRLKLCGFDGAYYHDDMQGIQVRPNLNAPSYRAPEIIIGYSAGYSIDVWATAMVMYEMVTNRKMVPDIKHNNEILYIIQCTLGSIPRDMIKHSSYSQQHFDDFKFIHMSKGVTVKPHFFGSNLLHETIQEAYHRDWYSRTEDTKRESELEKLSQLEKVLEKMLVLHPKERMPIEFVYANPFILSYTN